MVRASGGAEPIFSEQAWKDYLYWQKADKKPVQRINGLIREITGTPHAGTGKPEPLKHALSGYRSRRLNDEYRIVYKVAEDPLLIAQLRYHG